MEHVMAGPGSSLKMATANLLLLALFSFTLAGFTVSLHPSAREVLIISKSLI